MMIPFPGTDCAVQLKSRAKAEARPCLLIKKLINIKTAEEDDLVTIF